MLVGSLSRVQVLQPVDAKDGIGNSIVGICLHWIATSAILASLVVGTMNGKEFKPLAKSHPFVQVLTSPESLNNEWDTLLRCLVPDYFRRGNAYLHILRNRNRAIVAYEYLAARFVKPVPDDMGQLSHYIYIGGGTEQSVEVEDMIHFKYGTQELNPLLGVSPLADQYREIITDNSYSDYAGGLAKGGGIPPITFTPRLMRTSEGETGVDLDEETADALTKKFAELLENEPGKPRFIHGAVDMHTMGVKPDEMALVETRAMPETRIPASLGLPAALLQLYTGLQKSTDNNLAHSIKQGWRGCVLPMLRYFARVLTVTALYQFKGAREAGLVVWFDTSDVAELAEDRTADDEQSLKDFQAGVITLDEVRNMRGLATTPKIRAELQPKPAKEQGTGEQGKEPATGTKSLLGITIVKRDATGTESPKTLDEAIAQYRKALSDREAVALAEMSEALGVIHSRIMAEVEKLVSDMEAEDTVDEAWLYQAERLTGLLAQIEEQYRLLSLTAAPAVTDAQRDAVEIASRFTETLARASAGTPPEGVSLSWYGLNVEQLQSLVGAASEGSPLAELFDAIGPDVSKQVREALIAGVGTGAGPRETARMMRDSVLAKLALSRARAETIARTETMRSAREASRRTYMANTDVLEGWTWTAATDSRCCACCYAMHGSVHQTSDKLDGHMNCRCCMVPRTKSWAALVGDAELPDTRPLIEEGENIFQGLHDSDQRAVLGQELHRLYRDGDIMLADCVVQTTNDRWGTMRRAATVEEAKENAAKRTGQ